MRNGFAMKENRSRYGQWFYAGMTFACALVLVVGWSSQAMAQYVAFDDPPTSGSDLGGPDLKPSNPITQGGEVTVGGMIQVVSLFRNVTNGPLTIEGVNLYPSANVNATIGTDNCSATPITEGAECAISVNIQGVSPGAYRVEMLIDHDGRSRLTTTAISGNVVGSNKAGGEGGAGLSELEVSPGEIDFGDIETSSPLVRSILLTNSTVQPVTINDVSLLASDKSGFSVSTADCTALQPNQSCLATVMWAPYAEGQAEGVIVVRHTGPKGTVRVPVMGNFRPDATDIANPFPNRVPGKGLLISDRRDLDFGEEVDGASSITVSLVNAGDSPITLNSIKLGGSDNGLTLSSEGCDTGSVLDATEACALTVNWQPRRAGPVVDDIQIIHDGIRGVLLLPIRGEAEEPVAVDNSLVSVRGGTSGLNVPPLSGANIDYDSIVSGDGTTTQPSSNRSQKSQSRSTPSLDGYRVTSHGPTRAVIAGPFGRLIVRDGELQMIAGVQWITRIVPEGVELISDRDVILLVFDRSFNTGNKSTSTVSRSNNDD